MCAFYPSSWEAEASRSLSLRLAWSIRYKPSSRIARAVTQRDLFTYLGMGMGLRAMTFLESEDNLLELAM